MTQTITVNQKSFNVLPGDQQNFWNAVDQGLWETETYHLFDDMIEPDSLFIDVGAWIGSTALYAAQIAERTIAFEPDPIAFKVLQANIAQNQRATWFPRITAINLAVNADGSQVSMGSRSSGGDSMSSSLFIGEGLEWSASAISLSQIVAENATPSQSIVIKMDIEGGEYGLAHSLGPMLQDKRVKLILSCHPRFLRSALRRRHGWRWILYFWKAHLDLLEALPRTRDVRFGRHGSKSRILAMTRAFLTGSFTRQIVVL